MCPAALTLAGHRSDRHWRNARVIQLEYPTRRAQWKTEETERELLLDERLTCDCNILRIQISLPAGASAGTHSRDPTETPRPGLPPAYISFRFFIKLPRGCQLTRRHRPPLHIAKAFLRRSEPDKFSSRQPNRFLSSLIVSLRSDRVIYILPLTNRRFESRH